MKAAEEIKYLKLHIEQINQENESMKKEIQNQIEVTKQGKRHLSEYIGNITTQEEIITKMKTTAENLEVIMKSQSESIKILQYFY